MPNGKEVSLNVELPPAGSVPPSEGGEIGPEASKVVEEGVPGVTEAEEAKVSPEAVEALTQAAGVESGEKAPPAGAPAEAAEAAPVIEKEKPAWQTIIEEAKEKIAAERAKLPEKPKKKPDKKRAEQLDFARTELDSYQRYFEQKPEIDKQLAAVDEEIKAATAAYDEAIAKNDVTATQQALFALEEKQRAKEAVLAGIPKALREGKISGEWPEDIRITLQEVVGKLKPLMEETTPIIAELTREQLLERGQRVLSEFQRLYDEAANKGEELEKAEQKLGELLQTEGLTNEQYAQYLEEQGKAIKEKLGGETGDITKLTPLERRFWWEQIVNKGKDDIKANLEKIKDPNIWSDDEVSALYEALPEWVRKQDEYAPLRERKERIDLLARRAEWTQEQIKRAQELGIPLTSEEKAKLTPPPPPEFTQEEFNRKLENGNLTTEELKKAIEKGWCDPEKLTYEQKKRLQDAGVDLEAAGAFVPAEREEGEIPETPEQKRFLERLKERIRETIEAINKDKRFLLFKGFLKGGAWGFGFGAAGGAAGMALAALIGGPLGTVAGIGAGLAIGALKVHFIDRKWLAGHLERTFTEWEKVLREKNQELSDEKITARIEADKKHYIMAFVSGQIVGGIAGGYVGKELVGRFMARPVVGVEKPAAKPPTGEKPLEVPTTGQTPWAEEKIITGIPEVEKISLKTYTVVSGDTFSEIVKKLSGGDAYGPAFREFFLKNKELFMSKPGPYGEAAKLLVEFLEKNPDAVPRGALKATWDLFMKATHLIHPGDVIYY